MLSYLLDTNTVSYIVRGRSRAESQHLLNVRESACISVITQAEIQYGLARRPEATTLKGLMTAFLRRIQLLP